MFTRVLRQAACAALLCSVAPSIAGAQSLPLAAAASARAADAVSTFYGARTATPLWLGAHNQGAADTLVDILRRAQLDGLSSGPQLAREADRLIAAARAGDRAAADQAERLLSTAWVLYVQALKAPVPGMVYTDSSLARPAPSAQAILAEAARAPSLAEHVRSVAAVNPLYGELRQAALNEALLTGSVDSRLMANLERARGLPARGRAVIVDAASARLWMVENGAVVDSMKVIVGKADTQTPMLASTLHYATLNPYWNVPEDLVQRLIAPKVVSEGLSYLRDRHYQVVSEFGANAEVLDPASVDWKAVADGRTKLLVRQLPGPSNSMGSFKFGFANSGGIYLHDTPNKQLFASDQRDVSNGCIRLEDAPRLARWLLGRDAQAAPGTPEQHVALPRGVPVYITYLTARGEAGRLSFSRDIYRRDSAAPVVAALR